MSLTNKKYEKFYKTTGTGDDKIESNDLSLAEELWDIDRAIGMKYHLLDPNLAPLVFQLQQIQDELDYLRTEISANKSKNTFPGFGTSKDTALQGNTELLQLGTTNKTALAGDTTIPPITITLGKGLTLTLEPIIDTKNKEYLVSVVVIDGNDKDKAYKGSIQLK